MPFDLNRFVTARPYLYHLTATANIPLIRRHRRLLCAEQLLRQGGRDDLLDQRRSGMMSVPFDGAEVLIRDQDPLHKGSIAFEQGWTFAHFVRLLNQHVFFWPGTAAGPIPYGIRHFARYHNSRPTLIRVPTQSVFGNCVTPHFCRFNSGSPRCSRGRHSPRGDATFVTAGEFDGGPAQVVEVVFKEALLLPQGFETAPAPNGPWSR